MFLIKILNSPSSCETQNVQVLQEILWMLQEVIPYQAHLMLSAFHSLELQEPATS